MKTFLLAAVLLISTVFCSAQPQKGKVGISVAVQQSQFDFLVPFFPSDHASLAPAFGVSSVSDEFTDISLGLQLRYYISKVVVSPFIGGRIGVMLFKPYQGELIDSETDLLYGISFGGEHFFTPNFSVGIDLQLNIAKSGKKSMRFNNPDGTNISTGTGIFATIYF